MRREQDVRCGGMGVLDSLLDGRLTESASTSRERWAAWEARHGGFAQPAGKLRDKITPDKALDGFRTKDAYTMVRTYPQRAGAGTGGVYRAADSRKVRGTTVYGYDIHAPTGERIGATTTLRNATTQSTIDRHRQANAPTAAAGVAIDRIEEHYGKSTVIPLGGGAVLVHAKGAKTGGMDRHWHVSADGLPTPEHYPGQHVPHLR